MATKSMNNRVLTPAHGDLLNLVSLVFHLIPKNLLSFFTGLLARVPWPAPLNNLVLGLFVRAFGIDMSEAELPLAAYRSIEDVFTRRLKPGLRPITTQVASPADGYLARSGAVKAGTAVQAKGLEYSIDELLFGRTGAQGGNEGPYGWYQTIYLAPHNYHRVHAPFHGEVRAIRYLPGKLWPVNRPFVLRIPRLFAQNERLVFDVALESGGHAWLVMVGALNVGRMVTPLAPDLVTNACERQLGAAPLERTLSVKVRAGDELGTFMLGSTVVLIYDHAALAGIGSDRFFKVEGNQPILMGQALTGATDHD